MVNGTKPDVTVSGWPYSFLDCPSTELSLRFSDGDNGLARPVEVTVKRIVRERGHWPSAEVEVNLSAARNDPNPKTRRVFRGRLSLLSMSAKRDCVKVCKDAYPELSPQWAEVVETFTDEALRKMSDRVDPVMLGNGSEVREAPKFQVAPLLQYHQTNLLWGNSDIGKSWLGVYLCALVDNGLKVNGFEADTGPSLYVDYETTGDAMAERVRAVRAGLGADVPHTWELRYQTATGPLTDWIDDLGRYVSKNEIQLVVIDSLGLALGGVVNESENVVQLFAALRELDATTLLIDHQGKGEDANQRGAIGSSYKRHYARSEWEMRRAEDGDDFTIGLYHRKANNARRSAPIGLSLEIETDDYGRAQTATFTRSAVEDDPDLVTGLSIPQRIRASLSNGALTNDGIYERLPDKRQSSIDTALTRMVRAGQLMRPERGKYGLADAKPS